jgi:hypothetical protein
MTPWVFLVAPKLHKHVQKKAAHDEQTCKNDDRHETLPFGALVAYRRIPSITIAKRSSRSPEQSIRNS